VRPSASHVEARKSAPLLTAFTVFGVASGEPFSPLRKRSQVRGIQLILGGRWDNRLELNRMDPACEENIGLGQIVARAIESVYSLKQQQRSAIKNKDADADRFIPLLDNARKAQHEAESALQNHVMVHKCGRSMKVPLAR